MSQSTIQSEQLRFEQIGDAVCTRLAKNEQVRRNLPGMGRLRIDRQLPFLCVYRRPAEGAPPDPGTRELVTSEASYLVAAADEEYRRGLDQLCRGVTTILQECFGRFLLIEVWAELPAEEQKRPLLEPVFTIVGNSSGQLDAVVDRLASALRMVTIADHPAVVETRPADRVAPPGLPPVSRCLRESPGLCHTLGLAVRPIYRDEQTGTLFPMVLRNLRPQLARALRKAVAEFAGVQTNKAKLHYQSLGPSSMVKAVRLVDQHLCEISESFDFLLQVTPTNVDDAWAQFQECGYACQPAFVYRPLPYDPSLLKRRLFEIEVERIEDPTISYLFWEKQVELDRQLSALRDLNTPHFRYTILQLYDEADDDLVETAEAILDRFPEPAPSSPENPLLDVATVVQRAREEIDHYHGQLPEFNASVEQCDHIASGLMVSKDKLLVSASVQVRAERLEPLLHHEVGTHLVTYFNGRCQPFRQLYAGFAGYEELQEGLAVLAEYLCGGLTPNRWRSLAGRVIAVRQMVCGVSFVDTFRLLHHHYGFEARQSFTTTLRVYRGGGFAKDALYLRGLRNVLDYLGQGHDIEPLYVGKIGLRHVPYVQEMRRREVIKPPGVLPRFWDHPDFCERLESCRGRSLLELTET